MGAACAPTGGARLPRRPQRVRSGHCACATACGAFVTTNRVEQIVNGCIYALSVALPLPLTAALGSVRRAGGQTSASAC